MFEDYIRALILNLTKIEFEVIKEDYFKKEMKFIVENDERYKFNNYIDIDLLRNCYEDINEIRKNICHNKIMLNIENLNKKIEEFMNVLPEDYREGFRNIINDSKNKLVLDSSFIIKL